MQVSGLIDTRHKKPSNAHPMYRPSQNCAESPSSKATTAARSTNGPQRGWDATAAPAATKAMAAGKGSPIASANSSAKVRAYPCRAITKSSPFIVDLGCGEPRKVPVKTQRDEHPMDSLL